MIDRRPRSATRYGLLHAALVGLSSLVAIVLRALGAFEVRESLAVHDYVAVAQLALAAGPVFTHLYALPTLGVPLRFPRLTAAAVATHALAIVVGISGLALGGLEGAHGSWSILMAFDATRAPVGSLWLLAGLATMTLASALSALSAITSLAGHHPASGLAWATRARAGVELAAAPVVVAAVALLGLDRGLGLGLFDPASGGDPTAWLHAFWAGVHPLLATLALPLLGVVLDGPLGRLPRALFAIAAVTSMLGWGQHLFATGLSPRAAASFSGLSLLATWPLLVLLGFATRAAVRRPSVRVLAGLAIATWLVFGEVRSASAGLHTLTAPFWFRDGIDASLLVLASLLLTGLRRHQPALRAPIADWAALVFLVGIGLFLFTRSWGVAVGQPTWIGSVQLGALVLVASAATLLVRQTLVAHALRDRSASC